MTLRGVNCHFASCAVNVKVLLFGHMFCCRRLDILGAIGIIRQVLADEQQRQQAQQLHVQDLNSSSKSEGRSGYTDCVASRPALLLRALVEVSSIVPTNGSLSILNQGYSIGELHR